MPLTTLQNFVAGATKFCHGESEVESSRLPPGFLEHCDPPPLLAACLRNAAVGKAPATACSNALATLGKLEDFLARPTTATGHPDTVALRLTRGRQTNLCRRCDKGLSRRGIRSSEPTLAPVAAPTRAPVRRYWPPAAGARATNASRSLNRDRTPETPSPPCSTIPPTPSLP